MYAGSHAATTLEGKIQVADPRLPLIYAISPSEGNEQYNADYVEQVSAMEAKATALGMAEMLFYMFPQNKFLSTADIAKASQFSPRIDE